MHDSRTADTEPILLPLHGGDAAGGPTWVRARSIVDAAATDAAVTIDVPDGHVLHVDPALLTGLLRQWVDRACRVTAASTVIGRREVVVTSVLLPDAIELEVADSGAAPDAADSAWLTRQAAFAGRLGATLDVRPCAEGGTALTLRFARRLTERRAA